MKIHESIETVGHRGTTNWKVVIFSELKHPMIGWLVVDLRR